MAEKLQINKSISICDNPLNSMAIFFRIGTNSIVVHSTYSTLSEPTAVANSADGLHLFTNEICSTTDHKDPQHLKHRNDK